MSIAKKITEKALLLCLAIAFVVIAFYNHSMVNFRFLGFISLKLPMFLIILISFLCGYYAHLIFSITSKK